MQTAVIRFEGYKIGTVSRTTKEGIISAIARYAYGQDPVRLPEEVRSVCQGAADWFGNAKMGDTYEKDRFTISLTERRA